jgi:uncharacterized damage-inducible protein DinB
MTMPKLTDSYVMLARYNRWMNERVYDVAASLSDGERNRDLGAFFRSVHGTLDHILFGDRIWAARFGVRDAGALPAQGAAYELGLYPDFAELRRERAKTDAALEEWARSLTDDALGAPLCYSNQSGKSFEHPLHFAVQHLFNHQTHHRGQVTTLLKQLGRDPGVTDLIAMLRLPDWATT